MAHNVVETYTIRKSQDIHSHAYINQYELVSALGEGMHGKVMLAHDTKTNERVAIKIMRRNDPHNRRLPKSNRLGAPPMTAQQETESKIRREIAVMKKCSHQNLVRLREVIDDPASKKVYLVMENLEGGEVKWRSKGFDEPVLELCQVQRIMRDVTLGLEYLHHQGIIHRDIKPANLLWTEDRQSVKICDFGVSHFTAAAAQHDPRLYDEAGLTKTAGSPAFFAPEICRIPDISFDDSPSSPLFHRGSQSSNSPISPSSPPIPPITKQIDIWALGVTLYCLLFGRPPWQGQTEFAMFRAICTEDFHLPDTMCRERVPTGGRDRKPEGKTIGWCVVGLLEGLLEKDQDKRITLADMKCISWVQNGVREPDRWLRETAPNIQTRVVITDEDAKRAIKPARFSYPGWITRLTRTIKRVPLPLIPNSRAGSKGVAAGETRISTSSSVSKKTTHAESLGRAYSSRTRAVMDRQLKRFAISHVSPSRSNTVPAGGHHCRNSIGSSTAPHNQSVSDPTSHINHYLDPGPSSRRSLATYITTSSPRPRLDRRQSDSLQPPGSSSASVSPTPSPTTPDDHPVTGSTLRLRLSQAIRSNSVKKAVKGVKTIRPRQQGDDPPRGRTSAETLDVLRASEDLGLTPAMRASSWGSPSADAIMDDDDRRISLDLTGSEAGGVILQDFNKSVVRFGAGGYVDNPAPSEPAAFVYPTISPPKATGSGRRQSSPAAGMSHSDSSSNSTATAATPHPHGESPHHSRVRSPLARGIGSGSVDEEEEEEEGDLSSDVFEEDTGTDDIDEPDSSEEDVLELRTRRPSAILSRSANTSPLR